MDPRISPPSIAFRSTGGNKEEYDILISQELPKYKTIFRAIGVTQDLLKDIRDEKIPMAPPLFVAVFKGINK